jgi:hypothetical protein
MLKKALFNIKSFSLKIIDAICTAYMLLLAGFIITSPVIYYVILPIFETPGPSKKGACVIDDKTIRYQYTSNESYSGEHYAITRTTTAQVGDSGLIDLCTFEGLNKISDNTWEAVFRNRTTGKTASHHLVKCPKKVVAKSP